MRYSDGGGLTAKQRARREQVRFEVVELLTQGVTPPQVARGCGSHGSPPVSGTPAGGMQALGSKGPLGRPSRMKPEWRAWLAAELEMGPAAHGWTEDRRWTLARVATVIVRRFHVRFSPAQTWRILHQTGWTVP